MEAGGDYNSVISNRSCMRGEKVLKKKTQLQLTKETSVSQVETGWHFSVIHRGKNSGNYW